MIVSAMQRYKAEEGRWEGQGEVEAYYFKQYGQRKRHQEKNF